MYDTVDIDWTYYVFNHAITSMMEYPWACNDLMVNPQCNRSPAMWLMLPGILQCRPMEGSTTLINWRLQWWMPWYPVLTGTCAFGRVANLEFRCLRSFWMKKNHSSSGWMRRTCSPMLWCCRHRLISWVSTWLTPRWYSPDTTPGLWCRIAELQTGGVSCLCLVNLFSRSRIIQITVQLSPQDF